jgi:cation diffusion facilitator CzcD-associated flavoprotein CzcO
MVLTIDWSRRYAAAKEISQYYDGFAKKYGLLNNTRFNQKVIKAEWSDETMLWTVTSEHRKTKQKSKWTANVVVHATGLFNRAKLPAIPGASTFKGESWHTADWPTDANLKGKRVAIIGTGPSAAQVIPRIQPLVKSLTVYQRSTAFCLPRQDYQYSTTVHFLFNYIPFAHRLYCLCMYWFFEILLHKVLRPGTSLAGVAQSTALKHFESQVTDQELREKLRPTGYLGCKRMLVLDDYYPTFQQPNVELIVDPPIQITETGIVSKPVSLVTSKEAEIIKNELSAREAGDEINEELGLENYTPVNSNSTEKHTEVDVLIWGTGWVLQDFGRVYETIGRGGKTLAEHWGDDCHALYGYHLPL